MKHVIIGAGAAGISAARTIRLNKKSDEIVIISTDDAVYSRCMLHKFIGGVRNVAELSFIPSGFFEENNIRWRDGVTVTGLDTAGKRVLFNSGEETYDKLLIATGSKSVLPPIDGLRAAPLVCTLRDLSDAKEIRQKAVSAQNIVIIGAGLVGLDAAYGLVGMSKKPVIIERAKTVLPSNLDAKAAAVYQYKFENTGCRFMLESVIQNIKFNDAGTSCVIKLACGEELPADLLIVAAGVSPAIDFVHEKDMFSGKSLIVDKFLATNAEGVYAAGDATGLCESWPSAQRQGEIAALNMCAIAAEYDDILTRQNTVNFFGIPSLSVGRINPEPGDEEYIREDWRRYQKVITTDSIPVGVTLQGDISRSGFWQHVIKHKIPIADCRNDIWKTSFADSYALDDNGEYQYRIV